MKSAPSSRRVSLKRTYTDASSVCSQNKLMENLAQPNTCRIAHLLLLSEVFLCSNQVTFCLSEFLIQLLHFLNMAFKFALQIMLGLPCIFELFLKLLRFEILRWC